MIPHVFVSSTIEDLHHLRDAVREAIIELSYEPVMTDYGDVGYSPTSSVEDSCYAAVQRCQLAVLLVGKRYGAQGRAGVSITHQEFRASRRANVPLFTLVDREVWSYKKVFDANPKPRPSFPGMDNATGTFALLQEVVNSKIDNGIRTFASAPEACTELKRQIGFFFGELLRSRGDAVAPDVREILAEVKTLRHELVTQQAQPAPGFLNAMRFLLDRRNRALRDLLELLFGDVETALSKVADVVDLPGAVAEAGWSLEKRDPSSPELAGLHRDYYATFGIEPPDPDGQYQTGEIIAYPDRRLYLNGPAAEHFDARFRDLRQNARSTTETAPSAGSKGRADRTTTRRRRRGRTR